MTEEHQRSSPVRIMLFSVFAIVALYVFSIGPVVKLAPVKSRPTLEKIYAPLLWLSEKTSLSELLVSYVKWWKPKLDPSLSP